VNDSRESIEEVASLAFETGSRLYYDFLHLKPGLEAHLAPVLEEYREAASTSPSWRRRVSETVENVCRRLGVECVPAFPKRDQAQRQLL
jgi:hypothetical protein